VANRAQDERGEFAERVGLTPANVAVLKNGRAKPVRFSTLDAMCQVLGCQPGDLLEWVEETDPGPPNQTGTAQ
jgi:putative transcriptional regulator